MKQNERDFFNENILPHQESIHRLIIHLSKGDVQLAHEITQDTMFTALNSIKQIQASDNIKAYLHTIAKNKFHKHSKNYKELIPIGEIEDPPDTDELIADMLVAAETAEKLKRMLSSLDKKYSQVLQLHYYDDISLVEIARIYNVSYNTVYSWRERALKKMSELCKENGGF